MEFTGEFETHITVSCSGISEIDRLQQWSVERNLKFLHILLDRGETVSQPMLTRRGQGDFNDEREIAYNLSRSLAAECFSVARIKIEAAPGNHGVPQSDVEALAHPAHRYFEHHVKLLLKSAPNDLPLLREVVKGHSAHLSRNALQIQRDGVREQFITQRCIGIGRSGAEKQLQMLINSIESLGYSPIDIEAEFVVYDSNLALDLGWIQPSI